MRDPSAPLPSAPDPWQPSVMPAFRSRPPYVMTEMIAAEPAFAERLLRRLATHEAIGSLAEAVREAAKAEEPILLTGCGTSHHAAMGVASLLADGLGVAAGREPRAVQALESLWKPLDRGLVIGISHEGGTEATNEALRAARAAGARTALVTVARSSPGASHADIVVETEEQDQSWCHTIGYLSPLLVGAAVRARLLGERLDGRAIRALLDVSDDHRVAAAVVAGMSGVDRVLVAGSGTDLVTAHELALKIAEGARLPSGAIDVETPLHGHLAAATRWTGLVLVSTDATDAPPMLLDHTKRLLRAARLLGMPAAGVLGDGVARDLGTDTTPAGRIVLPRAGRVPEAVARLLGPIIPLQLLAERTARARGMNPDTLGREDDAQAAAHA